MAKLSCVATFADRDMAGAGPLDLTRLTWYGPAKGIMDRWAEQFVRIANREPGEAVTDPTPFTLRPFYSYAKGGVKITEMWRFGIGAIGILI